MKQFTIKRWLEHWTLRYPSRAGSRAGLRPASEQDSVWQVIFHYAVQLASRSQTSWSWFASWI